MKRLVGFKMCKTHHCIVIELYVLMYVNMFVDNIYIIVNTSLPGKDTRLFGHYKKKYNNSLFIWFRNLDPYSPLHSVGDPDNSSV